MSQKSKDSRVFVVRRPPPQQLSSTALQQLSFAVAVAKYGQAILSNRVTTLASLPDSPLQDVTVTDRRVALLERLEAFYRKMGVIEGDDVDDAAAQSRKKRSGNDDDTGVDATDTSIKYDNIPPAAIDIIDSVKLKLKDIAIKEQRFLFAKGLEETKTPLDDSYFESEGIVKDKINQVLNERFTAIKNFISLKSSRVQQQQQLQQQQQQQKIQQQQQLQLQQKVPSFGRQSKPLAHVPVKKEGVLTPNQLLQLRAQLHAFRLLDRSISLTPDILFAIHGAHASDTIPRPPLSSRLLFDVPRPSSSTVYGVAVTRPNTTPLPTGMNEVANRRRTLGMAYRVAEIRSIPFNITWEAKRKALIELKGLALFSLQRKVRTELYAVEEQVTSLAKFDRMVYRRERGHVFRDTIRDLEPSSTKSQAFRELRENFINKVQSASLYMSDYRINQRRERIRLNRAILNYHAQVEKKRVSTIERQEKDRIKALKENDEGAYMRMLEESKNERLLHLLKETDKYLIQIGALMMQQKNTTEVIPKRVAYKQKKMASDVGEGVDGADGAPPSGQEEKEEEEDAEGEGEGKGEGEEELTSGDGDEAITGDGVTPQDGADGNNNHAFDGGSYSNNVSIAQLTHEELLRSRQQYYTIAHTIKEEVTEQPKLLLGGSLKEYQLTGLMWLVSLYNNNLSGILADEMGLGKTIQTISLVAYLMESKGNNGPYLVIVPLATMVNWQIEFQQWAPDIKVIPYKGNPAERRRIQYEDLVDGMFNVCLTTYEFVLRDKKALAKIHWDYIIIDEGHRMKNAHCKLALTLGKEYYSKHRLMLTGTPLQNNIAELWSLLNFLLPSIFHSSDNFEQWFNAPFERTGEHMEMTEEEQLLVINRLHQVLRPFLLRRLKRDVLSQLPEKQEHVVKCELSGWQKVIYKQVQEKGRTCAGELEDGGGKASQKTVLNAMMQLRKACNHPYLFLDSYDIDHNLTRVSGKFELLSRILPKLKRANHRVLLFSQFTQLLDIMADWLNFHNYSHLRIDGNVTGDERGRLIQLFNAPGSPYFIFILSTRAGGLGINLQSADTVVIFDSDWNPQQDLQAQDRAHRIGQRNEVRVLRLVTATPVEEKILERATYKLGLEAKVISAGDFNNRGGASSAEERRQMLLHVIQESASYDYDAIPDDESINDMIARDEDERALYEQMDRERHQAMQATADKNGYVLPALMDESEVPDWVTDVIGKDEEDRMKEESTKEYGRGQRVRDYDRITMDGLTEREFLLAAEGEMTMEEILERKRERLAKSNHRRLTGISIPERRLFLRCAQQLLADVKALCCDPKRPDHRTTEIFDKLPSRVDAPEYYEAIVKPLDHNRVVLRLQKGFYKTAEDVYEALLLLSENAKTWYQKKTCPEMKDALMFEKWLRGDMKTRWIDDDGALLSAKVLGRKVAEIAGVEWTDADALPDEQEKDDRDDVAVKPSRKRGEKDKDNDDGTPSKSRKRSRNHDDDDDGDDDDGDDDGDSDSVKNRMQKRRRVSTGRGRRTVVVEESSDDDEVDTTNARTMTDQDNDTTVAVDDDVDDVDDVDVANNTQPQNLSEPLLKKRKVPTQFPSHGLIGGSAIDFSNAQGMGGTYKGLAWTLSGDGIPKFRGRRPLDARKRWEREQIIAELHVELVNSGVIQPGGGLAAAYGGGDGGAAVSHVLSPNGHVTYK